RSVGEWCSTGAIRAAGQWIIPTLMQWPMLCGERQRCREVVHATRIRHCEPKAKQSRAGRAALDCRGASPPRNDESDRAPYPASAFAALSTARTLAVATSLWMPTPHTVLPSGLVHST